jgi:hypothetical protein
VSEGLLVAHADADVIEAVGVHGKDLRTGCDVASLDGEHEMGIELGEALRRVVGKRAVLVISRTRVQVSAKTG